MNEQNYGSLEACQRLVAKGIVLETEHWHGWDGRIYRKDEVPYGTARVPAPSMAEVWRELPGTFNGADIEIWKVANYTYCSYCDGNLQLTEHSISNTNPADALIYLRIWLEERKEESHEPTI